MHFVDRQEEKLFLEETKELSKNKIFTLSLFGLRRVGKTRLLLETLTASDIYFFVNKDKSSESLLAEYAEMLKDKKLINELERIYRWEEFFKVIFDRFQGTIVFDEFQNFKEVEPSALGILQKYLDLYENKKGILFVFSGSLVGLLKKMFSDEKEPLYRRIKRKWHLKPLTFRDTFLLCQELNIKKMEEAIALYALFGGFPRYYIAIEDEGLQGEKVEKILERFFFMKNALFENEVKEILSAEFGKRSGLYYDILTVVSTGGARISLIASLLHKKETALTRQLQEMVNYFELLFLEKQVVGEKKLIFINPPLVNFWFRFFYKNLSYYSQRNLSFINQVKKNLNAYVGLRFELVCREVLLFNRLFDYETVGRQWGTIPGKPAGENQYEIDICAANEQTKEILFGECKWQEKADARRILKELKEKAVYVEWARPQRKEFYVLFAKSFKEKIKEPNLFLFDLKDLEKLMKKS